MSHRTALLLLALALAGCGRAKAPGATDARWFGSVTPPRRDVLRFNNGSEPETIDPGVMSGQPDGRIAHLLFEGLTAPDPRTLQPTPAQAYRWESSPDARTWTFHLRPGLAWTDGARVTAHDFVYAWRRVLSPATASRSAGMLYPIENAESYHKGAITDSTLVGVRAADDSTLVVRLAAPTAYFLFLTGHETYLPVPRTAIERWGGAWTDPGHIVTNGPFTLLRHSHGEKIELARNARYWDAGHVRLEGITAYAVDDLNTSTNLYKAGAIDWTTSGSIPAPYLPYLRHYADFVTGEYQATYFY
jgi:oligopeptide transport system substrate-binding protein